MDKLARWRNPGRVLGVDYARALAIIGMMGAHIGDVPEFVATEPATWLGLIHGNAAMLFGLLAGVSVAFMTGGQRIPVLDEVPTARLRLLGRGVFIFGIGVALELLGTIVAIILTFYGLLYLFLMPMLRWSRRSLVICAMVVGAVGPTLTQFGLEYVGSLYAPGFNFLFGGMYQLTSYLPLVMLGLALGRSDLRRASNLLMMVSGGLGTWLVAQALWFLLGPIVVENYALMPLFWLEPHSGSTIEIVASGGLVVAVLGACLLIPQALARVLRPLGDLGAMPLTAYTGHIVAIAILWPRGDAPASNLAWLLFTVVLLVGAAQWRKYFPKGPLEWYAAAIGMRAAGERAPRAD